jgi:hypothetical protein
VSNGKYEVQGRSLLCDPLFPASFISESDAIVNSSSGRDDDYYYCNSTNAIDLLSNNFNFNAPQAVTLEFCGQSTGPSFYHFAGGDSTTHPCALGVGHIVNDQCVNSGFYNHFNSGVGSLTQLQASFVFSRHLLYLSHLMFRVILIFLKLIHMLIFLLNFLAHQIFWPSWPR